MASLCRKRITNGGESNYHIFINSVKGISKILQYSGLAAKDVRIVCSQSKNSQSRNLSYLPKNFSISNTYDEVKPINFYTSTCFEGQDIYDENGRIFIVSDGYANHTKIDIQTSLIQICGRIRNSKYKNEVTQIYSTSKYKNISIEEFTKRMEAKIAEAENNAKHLNNLSDGLKGRIINNIMRDNEPYITVENNTIVVDRNVAKLEIVNYNIVNGIYLTQCNMLRELKKTGLNVTDSREIVFQESESVSYTPKMTFKQAFLEYCKLRENAPEYSIGRNYSIERIEFDKPLVKQAYEILGKDEVEHLKYHSSNIKRVLIAKSTDSENFKIFKMLEQAFPKQEPIPAAKIKCKIQEIYDTLGIRRTAKATDLNN